MQSGGGLDTDMEWWSTEVVVVLEFHPPRQEGETLIYEIFIERGGEGEGAVGRVIRSH